MKFSRTRTRVLTHVFVGVLAFSMGATMIVAAGVAGGVITACYNVATGVLRVETLALPCLTTAKAPLTETRITWNQTGPQGAIGATGPAGPAGPKGDTGASGPAGAEGPKGDTGAAGATGATGAAGAQGPTGATGPQGPSGAGISWKGTYSPTTAYDIGDGVEAGGSSWVATAVVPGFCGLSGGGTACHNPAAPPNATYWSLVAARGEDGATGTAGATGATGAMGAVGPSDGYGAHGTAYLPLPTSNSTSTTVAIANVPAGAYVVTGRVWSNLFTGEEAICYLWGSNSQLDLALLIPAADGDVVNASLMGTFTATGATTIRIQCELALGVGSGGAPTDAQFVAVKVAAVH
jgi:hypothetical protein